jgi:serine phosphatase RsbU (regulator of sigma subunit)
VLSQRSIEKRVEQELARDERWRVIVRGNNWLCPYCLHIGARELRMDEAIEEKIAQHFIATCPRWDHFQAEAYSIDRLRQTARYLVFKGRVLRWIMEDRRFRVLAEELKWLCPYCGETTEAEAPDPDLDPARLGVNPEESAFVGDVVGHLLKCTVFGEGEDRMLSVSELTDRQARRSRDRRVDRARALFEREPAFRLMDAERRWLCPYCAHAQPLRLEDERRPGEPFFKGLADHLDTCKAYQVLQGRPRPVEELRAKVLAGARARQLEKVRGKVERHPIWRVRDLDGGWFCPYCATQPHVVYPQRRPGGGSDRPAEEAFLAGVLDHLAVCEEYRAPNAQLKPRGEMTAIVQRVNTVIDRRRRLRKALVENPVFGVTDEFSNWVCPYCQKIQRHIQITDAAQESSVFDKTVAQVVDHLHTHCDGFREGQAPRARRADLEAVAQQSSLRASGIRNDASGAVRLIESFDEESWDQLKKDLQAVKTRVERAKQQEAGLQEARTKQLRLLPDVPEISGYEFARVYKPCDAVGGDFYNFFDATEGVYAIAVGDISGHGIEAALLMGLAKKLLEVHGRDRLSTAQTLCLANRDLFSDLDERTFVTVFYGLLDVGTRRFKFSRAGHDPLVLFNPHRTPPLQVLDSKGMALGMDEGPIFEQTIEELEIFLQPGDLVVQYTDGITETMNHENEQFGHERLYAVIEEFGHQEAEYVLWKIEKAVQAFCNGRGQADDMTMVAFKVLAP